MSAPDTSKALERTLLNWQRTTLSMFAVSALSIKLALLTQLRIPLLLVTLLALLGSALLILLRFTNRPNNETYVALMFVVATVIIVFLGAVCALSTLIS